MQEWKAVAEYRKTLPRFYGFTLVIHTLQFTTVHIKSSQSAVSTPLVAWRRVPTMFTASVITFLPVGARLTTNSLTESVTLRPPVYRKSVSLGAKPIQAHKQSQSQSHDRRSVGQSVLECSTHLGLQTGQKTPFLCCCFQLLPCKQAYLGGSYAVKVVVFLLILRSLLSIGFTCHNTVLNIKRNGREC
jgi:hypothetical protein